MAFAIGWPRRTLLNGQDGELDISLASKTSLKSENVIMRQNDEIKSKDLRLEAL